MNNETTTTINDETSTSIAAILEYIQLPNHPFHAQAKRQAAKFIQAEKDIRSESNRRMMQEQRRHISDEEWSRIVD